MTNKDVQEAKTLPLLEVKNLKMYFPLQVNMLGKARAHLRAVDDVSFKLNAGQTIGVVGESGCGKTTLGRTILKLYEATGGRAIYYGKSIDEFLPKYYVQGIKRLPLYLRILTYYKKQVQNLSDQILATEQELNATKAELPEEINKDYSAVLDLCHTCLKKYDLQEKLKNSALKEEKKNSLQNQLNQIISMIPEDHILSTYSVEQLNSLEVQLKNIISLSKRLFQLNKSKKKYEDKSSSLYIKSSYSTGGCILSSKPKELSHGLLNLIHLQKKIHTIETKRSRAEERYVNKLDTLEKNLEKFKQHPLESDAYKQKIQAKENRIATLKNNNELKKAQVKETLAQLEELLTAAKTYVTELKREIPESDFYKELEENRDKGLNLIALTKNEMRSLRTDIQLIFQDPYSSLPPRMTVGAIIAEAVKVHHIVPKKDVHEYVLGVMKKCGLQPQYYDRYPHEFSGGQRQRICIARALAVKPRLVICDEPVSALDVSIQAQIINLLKELQNTMGLTYVFISHDLSVVKYITDDVMVMYLGNVMEIGKTKDIFDTPLHPYTEALFSAVPVPNPNTKMNRIILKGDIPSPANPPKGCKFHTRCNKCMGICKALEPKFLDKENNHFVSCHLYDEEVMNNRLELENKYQTIITEQDIKEGSQKVEEK